MTTTSATDPLISTRDRLAAAAASAKKRRATTTALLGIAVLVVFGYFAWAYSEIAKLDAPTVVAAIETQFDPVLNQPPEQIAAYMEEQAPEIVGQVEELVKQAPKTLAKEGKELLWRQTDATLAELEEELYQGVIGVVRQAKVEAQDRTGGEPVTPEHLEKLLTDLGRQAGASIDAALTQGQQRYQAESADILAYLDHLASGENLEPLDRLHRQIFTDFLALIEVWQTTGGDGTAPPVPFTK